MVWTRGRKATAVGVGRALALSGLCTLWSVHLSRLSFRGLRQEWLTEVSVGKEVSWGVGWGGRTALLGLPETSLQVFSRNRAPELSRQTQKQHQHPGPLVLRGSSWWRGWRGGHICDRPSHSGVEGSPAREWPLQAGCHLAAQPPQAVNGASTYLLEPQSYH